MGKHCQKQSGCLKTFKCVVFNLTVSGSAGLAVQTDLYAAKNKNTITLQWCTFGGQTSAGQVSTTAQNLKLSRDLVPLCEQTFVISGLNADTGQKQPMKLRITPDGDITFIFSVSELETPSFVTIEGGSATWILFNCE